MVHAVHDNASETENKCFVRPMATSDRDRAQNQLAYNVTMCCFFVVTYVSHLLLISDAYQIVYRLVRIYV